MPPSDILMTFIGDVHGNINAYKKMVASSRVPTFQLGDMGAGFTDLIELPKQHLFIRGNHDDPAICAQHPNYAGDYGYDEERKLFWLGGAYSIDAEFRKRQMQAGAKPSWWEDEELSPEQLDAAFEQYVASRPMLMATHDCPASIRDMMLTPMLLNSNGKQFAPSRTVMALEAMFQAHQPKIWVFGHYHVNWRQAFNGTSFVCLDELSGLMVERPKFGT